MHSASLLTVAAFSAAAQAASFTVNVGQGGNVFEPSTITAQVGDQVVFKFGGSAHSVVQSTFDDPCSPLAGGFEVPTQSGSGATFTIDVTSTDPQWFYCAFDSHCQSGMVGVINPPTGETQSDFAQKAQGSKGGSQPNSVVGGTLVADGKTSAGASATASGSSPSGSASTTGTGTVVGTASVTQVGGSSTGASSKSTGAAALASAAPAALALVAGVLAYI